MQKPRQPPLILVLNDLSLRSGRDIQRGILEYLDYSGVDWELRYITKTEAHAVLIPELLAIGNRSVGILLAVELEPSIMDMLSESRVPFVAVGLRHPKLEVRTHSIAFVRNDNIGIGRLAAEYLVSLGKFNSYAFVPACDHYDRYWSDERLTGFIQSLQKANIAPCIPAEGTDIAKWLCSLPKPTAILAACDTIAERLFPACAVANLGIPQTVAILGVDNDDLICRQCRPTLSSILPGHHEMGYAAARELDRLLAKKASHSHPHITIIRPKDIVQRGSTRILPPATALVRRMKDFIRINAVKGISVSDVVHHVHVSRRLAELRFHELENISLRRAIEDRKLALAQRLLVQGKRTVSNVAHACGFTSGNQLTRVFKLRLGQSIREWQKSKKALTCVADT